MTKIESEQRVVELMIRFYCNRKHGSKAVLCAECNELLNYAHQRLIRCPFQEKKPACKRCNIHCYKSDKREMIRAVMRYSAPRMLFYRPMDFLVHFMRDKRR